MIVGAWHYGFFMPFNGRTIYLFQDETGMGIAAIIFRFILIKQQSTDDCERMNIYENPKN